MSDVRLPPSAPPLPEFAPPGSTAEQPGVPPWPPAGPSAPDPTLVSRPPSSPGPDRTPPIGDAPRQPPARSGGSKIALVALAVLGALGIIGLVSFSIASYIETDRTEGLERRLPTVVEQPNDRTVTFRESYIMVPGDEPFDGRFTVDLVDEFISHEAIEGGIDWIGDGSVWFTEDGAGEWTRFHNTPADQDVDASIFAIARMRTIDHVLPEPVRPYVAVVDVRDTMVGEHAATRYDLLIDTQKMQRESRVATDAFVEVWGRETVDQDAHALTMSVWVDDDGVLWRFTSESDFDGTFWTVIYEEVSDGPFDPGFPTDFVDAG